MACDLSVKKLPGRIQNAVNSVHPQILHTAAFPTDEMIVGGDVRVKVIRSVPQPQPLDFPPIRQQGQIAVHRTQADIGVLLPNIPIYDLCRGMIAPSREEILDQLPLPAIFQRHGSSFPSKISNDYYFSIKEFGEKSRCFF